MIDPHVIRTVKPYVSELTTGVIYPEPEIIVLSPERTFWEKITLIHVACNRNKFDTSAKRNSRHWYDIAQIWGSWAGESAINKLDLFADVVSHKKVFFKSSGAEYDRCLEARLTLIPDKDARELLKTDYSKMCDAGMISGEVPEFEKIVDVVSKIEKTINAAFLSSNRN